jgi:hypothetical protein
LHEKCGTVISGLLIYNSRVNSFNDRYLWQPKMPRKQPSEGLFSLR